MRLFDPKIKGNIHRYILQCLGVTVLVYLILIVVQGAFERTIIYSLGATTFIIFTMPHKNVSKARYILGGYTIGLIVGSIVFFGLLSTGLIPFNIAGAVSIGLSILLMTLTNTEHPPAAAFTFGLVSDGIQLEAVMIVYFVLVTYLLAKRIFKKWLIDLL